MKPRYGILWKLCELQTFTGARSKYHIANPQPKSKKLIFDKIDSKSAAKGAIGRLISRDI